MNSTLIAIAIVGGIVLLALAYIGYRWYALRVDLTEFEARLAEAEAEADGGTVEAPWETPEISGGPFGLLKTWRARAKQSKMARKGYVKWYLVDGTARSPKWVKPKPKGAGVPEYHHGDHDYLFPDAGLVMDSQTGARVAFHHKGEPEPINLAEPGHATLDGDTLSRIINLEAESEPPSWLSNLDIDPTQAIIWGTIGLVMAAAAAQQFL